MAVIVSKMEQPCLNLLGAFSMHQITANFFEEGSIMHGIVKDSFLKYYGENIQLVMETFNDKPEGIIYKICQCPKKELCKHKIEAIIKLIWLNYEGYHERKSK